MIYNLHLLYIFSKDESPKADTEWFPEADHWETSGGEAELVSITEVNVEASKWDL